MARTRYDTIYDLSCVATRNISSAAAIVDAIRKSYGDGAISGVQREALDSAMTAIALAYGATSDLADAFDMHKQPDLKKLRDELAQYYHQH